MLEGLFVALMGQKKVNWSLKKKNHAWVSIEMNREYMQMSNDKSRWPGGTKSKQKWEQILPKCIRRLKKIIIKYLIKKKKKGRS